MVCSHYELEAQDKDGNTLVKMWVYSFDEAHYWTDEIREGYPAAVKFMLKYPDKDVYEKEKTDAEQPRSKKAQWIQTGWGTYCSNCGCKNQTTGFSSFCPNCWADMRKEKTDG